MEATLPPVGLLKAPYLVLLKKWRNEIQIDLESAHFKMRFSNDLLPHELVLASQPGFCLGLCKLSRHALPQCFLILVPAGLALEHGLF
jgi:hypothetical protein